jgi:hypothetical protein
MAIVHDRQKERERERDDIVRHETIKLERSEKDLFFFSLL